DRGAPRAKAWGVRGGEAPRVQLGVLGWQRLEMARGIAFHLGCTHEELRVGNELLHRPDVHLTRTQTGRTHRVLDMLAVREIVGAEIELFSRRRQHVPDWLRVLAIIEIAV